MIAALVALALAAAPAGAQERVVSSQRVDAWDRADLSWVTPAEGEPIRVLVRGSVTCALDGSEIDAREVALPGRTIADVAPLVFPEGTRYVGARGLHQHLFEIPPGRGGTIALNVLAIASRNLVTATEARQSITGAITVEVLDGAPPASLAGLATLSAEPVPPPYALAGAAVGVPLLALGLFLVARRRASREDALLGRAVRARRAIVREASVLGAAFDGALASAETLYESARRQRSHLQEIDHALARTGFVRAETAAAGLEVLRARRAEGLTRLESIVGRLEETVVRMAACVADRAAIADLARDLDRLRGELEVGEGVEQELAQIR